MGKCDLNRWRDGYYKVVNNLKKMFSGSMSAGLSCLVYQRKLLSSTAAGNYTKSVLRIVTLYLQINNFLDIYIFGSKQWSKSFL